MAKKAKKPQKVDVDQAVIDRFTNDQFGGDITGLPGFKWTTPQKKATKKPAKKK